ARLLELPILPLGLIEKSHVLDRDRRLVGESRYQLDLLFGERSYLGTRQGQNADGDAVAQHRHAEYRAKAAQLLGFDPGIFRVGQNIGDMDNPAFQQGSSHDLATLRHDRDSPDVFEELWR